MPKRLPAYDMTPNQERLAGLPGAAWGKFTRYLEIGLDRYATRQVDWFENGYALRYDRDHYVDEFGTLADLRYSGNWTRWWPDSQSTREVVPDLPALDLDDHRRATKLTFQISFGSVGTVMCRIFRADTAEKPAENRKTGAYALRIRSGRIQQRV